MLNYFKKVLKKRLKSGDVVLNRQNENKIAKFHPLVQIDSNSAVILSTKKEHKDKTVKGIPLDKNAFKSFEVKDDIDVYATNTLVNNSVGEVLGKITDTELNKIKQFISKK